jgi:trimeric autotransporter adhesin
MKRLIPSAQINTTLTFALLAAFAMLASGVAFGQIKSGVITGTVSDPTGAVIPGATVTVVNQETNITATAVTDESGGFTVPYLAPGLYTVNVEKAGAGFSKHTQTGVTVSTAQTVRVEVRLQAGATTDTVTVTSDAAALQTSSATVGGAVNERLVQALPNITHNPFQYAVLQAGVVPRGAFNNTQNTFSFGIGIDGRRQASAISINGGAAFSNDIMLDGVSVQGSAWNEAAVLPNQEALQEVKTITNNYSAEYGRAQGVIIFTTKGGTNEYHGSGYWRIRNEALNANSFQNNSQGITRGPFKSHSYGGTFGGRIIRDKAFFFVSYEGLRFNRNYDFLKTVPTALERKGDFSETYVNVSGRAVPVKLYDPFNATRVGTTSTYNRAQFPTFTDAQGVVRTAPLPAARLNQHGLALLNAYPLPNRAPNDIFNTNNFFYRGLQTFRKNVVNSRVDYHWGNHNFYATGGIQQGNIATPRSWGPDNPYYSRNEFVGNQQPDNNPYAAIGDTWTISPSLVADIRFGINRIQSDNEVDIIDGYDYGVFGIPQSVQAINIIPGAPPTFIPGRVSALHEGSFLHKRERQTNSDLNGSLTWTRGRWTHKFGGTYRVLLSNYIDPHDSLQIHTGAEYTRANINAAGSTAGLNTPDASHNGLAIASIALGAGFLEVRSGFAVRLALAQKYGALYTQNDWRVNDKLTLNLGLRWDVQPGPTERYNRISSIDLDAKNPFGTAGRIIFPSVNVDRRNMWPTQYKDFGPRFGFAYQIRNSTVLRGGYGLTYIPSNTGYNDGPGFYGVGPFSPATINSTANATTAPGPYGSNPAGVLVGAFNAPGVNTVVLPIGADENNPGIYGPLVRRFPQDYKNGYVQQWNTILEQKLGNNTVVSAGYIASKGSRLQVTFINMASPQFVDPALLREWRNTYVSSNGATNPSTQQIPNPYQPATGPLIPFGGGTIRNRTISRLEAALPWPHHGNNIHYTVGTSDYHALQLQITRQFSSGLQFNAHYTWSKLIEMSSYNAANNNNYSDSGSTNAFSHLRPEQWDLNRKLSTNDTPHRFVASWVYDLPVGNGKLLNLGNSLADKLVGGWRLGGAFTASSGFVAPLSNGGTNSINGLPDRVPGVPLELPKNLQKWYDGRTQVTLPSGRVITPCNRCFLKYNIDAFAGRLVTTPNGSVIPDLFWYGTSAATFNEMRSPSIWNVNLSLEKSFRFGERFSAELSAQATNLFNHTQFRPGLNTSFGGTVIPATITANPTLNLKLGQLQDTANTWGTYTQNAYDARQIEMVLKVRF